jgi:hypothetical protein
MKKLFLIFSSKLTDKLERYAKEISGIEEFASLPDYLQNIWSQVSPYSELLLTELNKILGWLKVVSNKNGYILINRYFVPKYYILGGVKKEKEIFPMGWMVLI